MNGAALERLIRLDRAIVAAGLAGLCLLSWFWIWRGAGMGMPALEMTRLGLFPHLGPPAGQMNRGAPGWDDFLLAVAMWWVMMVAMMLPAAAPTMLLYARTARVQQERGRMAPAPVATGAFLAGYLAVWFGFSIAAAALQVALAAAGALSPMMLWSQSPYLSAGFLALAALYQLTPAKAACLAHCRSPVEWLSRHWRADAGGALRMGLAHGVYCVGCCWTLMLLLFVGGVMNLVWIAALAVLVLVEKLGLPGMRGGWLSAVVLGLWALATLLVR